MATKLIKLQQGSYTYAPITLASAVQYTSDKTVKTRLDEINTALQTLATAELMNSNGSYIQMTNGTNDVTMSVLAPNGSSTSTQHIKGGDNITVSYENGDLTIAASYTDTMVTQGYKNANKTYPILLSGIDTSTWSQSGSSPDTMVLDNPMITGTYTTTTYHKISYLNFNPYIGTLDAKQIELQSYLSIGKLNNDINIGMQTAPGSSQLQTVNITPNRIKWNDGQMYPQGVTPPNYEITPQYYTGYSYTAGVATRANNLSGGSVGKLAYQTAANTTSFTDTLPDGTKAVTQSTTDNSTNVATTEFVKSLVDSEINKIGHAMNWVGSTNIDPTVTAPTTIEGHSTWSSGDVIGYNGKEYVLTGTNSTSNWRELGDESSHALNTITITGDNGLTGGGNLQTNQIISHATVERSDTNTTSPNSDQATVIKTVTTNSYGHVTGVVYQNVLKSHQSLSAYVNKMGSNSPSAGQFVTGASITSGNGGATLTLTYGSVPSATVTSITDDNAAIDVTANGTAYTVSHNTAAGYKHIPAGDTAGKILMNTGTDGAAVWGQLAKTSAYVTNLEYSVSNMVVDDITYNFGTFTTGDMTYAVVGVGVTEGGSTSVVYKPNIVGYGDPVETEFTNFSDASEYMNVEKTNVPFNP